MEKGDIVAIEDIKIMLASFYSKVRGDAILTYVY